MQNQDGNPQKSEDDFNEFLKRLSDNSEPTAQEPTELNVPEPDQSASQAQEPTDDALDNLRNLFVDDNEPALPSKEPIPPLPKEGGEDLDAFFRGLGEESSTPTPEIVNEKPSIDQAFEDRLNSLRDELTEELVGGAPENKESTDGILPISAPIVEPEIEPELVPEPTSTHSEIPNQPEKQEGGIDQVTPKEPEAEAESHWENVENRLADLQQNFSVDISEKEKKLQQPSLLEILNDENPTGHFAGKLVYGVLIFIILALIGVIIFALFRPAVNSSPLPTEVAIMGNEPLETPYPSSIIYGNTEISLFQEDLSNSTNLSAEKPVWFRNTEVVRMVYLPSKSPHPDTESDLMGKIVQLRMSNGDIQSFSITSMEEMEPVAFFDLTKNTEPSIAIAFPSSIDASTFTVIIAELALTSTE